jgi:glucose/arabinose dehydrogenase
MKSWRYITVLVTTLIALLFSGCSTKGSTSTNDLVTLTSLFDTVFTKPVALVPHPADDTRWFVLEKAGLVLMMDTDILDADPVTVLDISDTVDDAGEGGLLDITFHPSFADSGQLFLSYTASGTPLTSHISSFQMDTTGVIVPGSEETIITLDQPETNHNGGCLAFGPDGYLYIGFGDGGGHGDPLENGQDTTNLFGTILRIDVDSSSPYTIPAGNVFATSGTEQPEIYAWGLRNPWRFSFDRQEGTLWTGDVGQDAWEEIDIVTSGSNYGWNLKEGTHCYSEDPCDSPGLTEPVVEYGHSEGRSVTGGYVYRGLVLEQLAGSYIFGDFTSGRLWSVDSAAPAGTPVLLAETGKNIVSFAQDNAGELYLLDYHGGVYRIDPKP